MVTTSGFAGAPISRILILGIVSTSLLTSILDFKHLAPIKPTPHLWPYLQFSRTFTYQLAYISSSELLFAVVLLYQVRVLERLWGSRRFASLVAISWGLVGGLVVGLGVVTKVLTAGMWGYIPPGLTGVVVVLLVVWREEVPRLYGVKVVGGLRTVRADVSEQEGEEGGGGGEDVGRRRNSGGGDGVGGDTQPPARATVARSSDEVGIVLSDKFTTYLMAAQLVLSQFPYQLLTALVGWVVGVAWREELLPTSMLRWRIPAWVVGETADAKGRGQYEGLRRRLEEEGGGGRDGMREVSDRVVESREAPQRGIGQRVLGYFTSS